MKNLYIMCGVPGVGKSTLVREKLIPNLSISTKVISRDEIRFSMIGVDEEYFSHEKEVFQEFIRQIKYSLKMVDNTIVDATHINSGSRTKLLRNLGKSLKNVNVVAIVVINDLEIILDQNKQRTGLALVPEQAIINMNNSFEMPKLEEGFNEIMIYKNQKCIYDICSERLVPQ